MNHSIRINLLNILGALVLFAPTAFAVSTDTWVGGSANFSTTANWTYSSGSGPLASGDLLTFAAAGSTAPNNDETGFTYGNITFNSGASADTIGGNAFTLNGTIANSAANAEIINNNITLNATESANATSGNLTLGGIISDGGHNYVLSAAGGGGKILTLSGVNTYGGGTTISSGTLSINTTSSLGSGNITMANGASSPTLQSSAALTLSSGLTITIGNSGHATVTAGFVSGTSSTIFEIDSKITGSSGNVKSGSNTGTVRFANDTSDYATFQTGAGTTEFTSVANAGTASALGAGSGGGLGNTTYAIVNGGSGATLSYVGSGNDSTTRQIDWQGTTGALTLGANGSGAVQYLATGNLKSGSGSGAFTLNGSNTGNNTLAQVVNDSTGTTTLTKSGASTWILTGANTFSGTTAINQGILNIATINSVSGGASSSSLGHPTTVANGTIALGASSSGAALTYTGTGETSDRVINLNGVTTGGIIDQSGTGLLKFTSSFTATGAGSKTLTLQGSTAGTGEIDGAIVDNSGANTTAITKTGSGTWTLAGANTYSGVTSIQKGILNIATINSVSGGASSSSLGHPITVANGTINLGASSSGAALTYTGTGETSDRVINLNGATTGGIIDQSGTGLLKFTSSITATGVGAKTLTLQGSAAGTGEIDGAIVDSSGGATSLTKTGSGSWTLGGVNTFSGNVKVSAGTLALTGSASIANTTNITIGAGAKFDVSGLTSPLALGSSQSLTGSGATGTINGSINLSLGALALNYTNGTPTLNVTNGTLSFNGNAVTVTVSGSQLASGSYKLISTNSGGLVFGTLPSTVTVNGAGAVNSGKLQIISGELYLLVNHPPTATLMTVTRTAGLSLKIALSDVATNWSDVDGDTVTLSGINLATANNVNLSTNSTFIFYTNSPNVNDQFSYSITDGQGGTNTGLVNIVIVTNVIGQPTGLINPGGGAVTVSFAGIPAYSYNVQRSTNLVDWATVWTTNASANGVFNFTDTFIDLGGTAPSSAYYRLGWNQ